MCEAQPDESISATLASLGLPDNDYSPVIDDLPDLSDSLAELQVRDGRRNVDGSRQFEVVEIQGRHREIMRLHMLGMPHKEIAEILQITTQTVSNTLNSSIVKQRLAQLQNSRDKFFVTIRSDLEDLLPGAVDVYRKILGDEVEASISLKKKAAEDILGMHGISKVINVNSRHQQVPIDSDRIESIKSRAIQAAINSGKVVDTSATEMPS